jgi:hypothetical protein
MPLFFRDYSQLKIKNISFNFFNAHMRNRGLENIKHIFLYELEKTG